jgi:hypothetical protein
MLDYDIKYNRMIMKNTVSYIILVMVLFGGCSSANNERLDISKLFSFDYERPKNPNQEQISIVRYVLKNTYENNIHKMRGETENEVYVHKDGSEAVYDKDGDLVTNSYNKGSFNYYSNETEPIKKFIFDIAPWILWGNTEDDPTTFNERLYYYTLDLDYGIQSYIFDGSKETLEIVQFNELSKNEKEVYYIFLKLLFNEKYKIKLNHENIQRLTDDGKYYFEYFYQIQEMLNVRQ